MTASFLFQAEGFKANPRLVSTARAKTARLLRRLHPRLVGVSLRVRHEPRRHETPAFASCATAITAGTDLVVHAAAGEPGPALNSAFRKLERALAAAGSRQLRRRQAARRGAG